MKLSLLCLTVAMMAFSEARAQLVLQAGESYTYSFSSLAFRINTTFGIAGPSGTVFAYINPTFPESLGPTNSYRVELFEDTPAGIPIFSRTITSASSIFDTDYRTPNAWGDLQGSFRVTALSGSIVLQGFSLQAIRRGAIAGFDIFDTDRIFLPASPVLSIVRSNTLATVQWTTPVTNFVLEASSMASTAPWETITNPVAATGNVFSVTLPLDEANRFFRLRGGP